jgi:hypothetical protein
MRCDLGCVPTDCGESNHTRKDAAFGLFVTVARGNACAHVQSTVESPTFLTESKHLDVVCSVIGRKACYCALGNELTGGTTGNCTMPLIVNTEPYIASVWVKLSPEIG